MGLPSGSGLFLVSDVHWGPADAAPDLGPFGRFLAELGRCSGPEGIDLWILGDLFDFWYERGERIFDFYRPHAEALAAATAAGIHVHLLFGNRDFTFRGALPRRSGVEVVGDRAVLRVGERRVSLQHGDLLCSDDWRYQFYRRMARSPFARLGAGLLPWSAILRLIAWMRRQSEAEVSRKTASVMQVVDRAVARELDRGFDLVVCGHVHRAERRPIPGAQGELMTLGPWDGDCGSYARQEGGDLVLHSYP
jgi:UDP-2,3-diacylglucosamine hydrolase